MRRPQTMRETQNPAAFTAGPQSPPSVLWTRRLWTSPRVSPYSLRVEAQKQGDKWLCVHSYLWASLSRVHWEETDVPQPRGDPVGVSGQVKTWGKFSFLFLFGLSVYSYISVTNGYYFYKKEIEYQAQPPMLSWLYPQIIAY